MPTTAMLETSHHISPRIVAERCGVYQREFGLNAFYTYDGIYVSAGSVMGLTLPRPLAARVVATEGVAPVPVVSIHPTVWMLLADGPASMGQSQRIAMRLLRFGVMVVVPRGLIGLPTPGDATRVWIRPPQGRTRPSITALADAVADTAAEFGDRRRVR
ncbi:hypothetical protein [Nocardia arthritidis]|uniref:Uncharacterized protein n=1 Tax=Nocardia arthritidis TaxID=228602 RepID=A0A6G9Y9U7_9NOCA|nr:hypothetical protein [Nocardia arthritidis]QIS09823.1 hypothetical protein F5544_09615 [Nocardia arthritidis]